MIQKKIADGSGAEGVVRRQMEAQYGDKLKNVYFRKSWLSNAATQQFWEVEGTVEWKKGLFSKQKRNFRYQIEPEQGNIIGKEEIAPK
ncbi:MAG: hypothetical protein PHY28_04870 [Dehalococcoidales bacterium]|nr:hypothetical protein [Dehalococcoidales bacterium]